MKEVFLGVENPRKGRPRLHEAVRDSPPRSHTFLLIDRRGLISVGTRSRGQANLSIRAAEVTRLQSSCYSCLKIWRGARAVRKAHLRSSRLGEGRLPAAAREILIHEQRRARGGRSKAGAAPPRPHARHGRGHLLGTRSRGTAGRAPADPAGSGRRNSVSRGRCQSDINSAWPCNLTLIFAVNLTLRACHPMNCCT